MCNALRGPARQLTLAFSDIRPRRPRRDVNNRTPPPRPINMSSSGSSTIIDTSLPGGEQGLARPSGNGWASYACTYHNVQSVLGKYDSRHVIVLPLRIKYHTVVLLSNYIVGRKSEQEALTDQNDTNGFDKKALVTNMKSGRDARG